MIHKIKLRKSKRNEIVVCPYNQSGICYRKGCIFKPEINCMKIREFKEIMNYAHKHLNKKKTRVKGAKKYEN